MTQVAELTDHGVSPGWWLATNPGKSIAAHLPVEKVERTVALRGKLPKFLEDVTECPVVAAHSSQSAGFPRPVCDTVEVDIRMGNRFDASLQGRVATAPALGGSPGGQSWAKFRLAVDDRVRNAETGEWEKAQTVFHDVVVFGKLAERTVAVLSTGDPVLAQGEFRFQSYRDTEGKTRTGTSFVASRLGPDILLADVTVSRDRDRQPEVDRAQAMSHEVAHQASPDRSL